MFLKPDYNLANIYEIDLEDLKTQGINAILFDLDSTIMASKSACYSQKTIEWLSEVRKDFFVGVVSNNANPVYVEKVKAITDFPVVFDANKPNHKPAQKFMQEHNLSPEKTIFVGDRPLTDIWCGKKLGCKTILVDSITAETENKPTRFIRCIERLCIKK